MAFPHCSVDTTLGDSFASLDQAPRVASLATQLRSMGKRERFWKELYSSVERKDVRRTTGLHWLCTHCRAPRCHCLRVSEWLVHSQGAVWHHCLDAPVECIGPGFLLIDSNSPG